MGNVPAGLFLVAPVGIIHYFSKCLALGFFFAFLTILTNLAGTSYCLFENYCQSKKQKIANLDNTIVLNCILTVSIFHLIYLFSLKNTDRNFLSMCFHFLHYIFYLLQNEYYGE